MVRRLLSRSRIHQRTIPTISPSPHFFHTRLEQPSKFYLVHPSFPYHPLDGNARRLERISWWLSHLLELDQRWRHQFLRTIPLSLLVHRPLSRGDARKFLCKRT